VRVIVTGARDWDNRTRIYDELDALLAEAHGLILVHGACPNGADAIADDWAKSRQARGENVLVDRFPANWGNYGRAAGMRRNAEMVASGAHLCLAFLAPASRGARHTVKLARRAEIETRVFGDEA
jgi:hypothetical protein